MKCCLKMLVKCMPSLIFFRQKRLSRTFFAEAYIKRALLQEQKEEIEVLAVGSSHCALGFNPHVIPHSFNLGNSNQDLFTAYHLVKKYISFLPNLKNLIVFYSLFSPGHQLEKTSDIKQAAVNYYLFDIPYSLNFDAYRHSAKRRFKQMLLQTNSNCYYGYIPKGGEPVWSDEITEYRYTRHMRENHRKTNQTQWLEKIISLCKERDVNVIVVIPPLRSDFNKKITELDSELFSEVIKISQKENISIFNYRTSPLFNDTDFIDSDHLAINGAIKLTNLISVSLKSKFRK